MNPKKNQILSVGFKKYSLNTFWLLLEKVLRLFSGLFIGTWVANYLGVELFGTYNYSLSFTILFTSFASLGLDNILIRELVNQQNKEELIGSALGLRFIGFICMLLILFLTIFYLFPQEEVVNSIIIVLALASFFEITNIIDLFFQSQVMGKLSVYAKILPLIISAFLKLFLVKITASVEVFAWVVFIENLFISIGLIYIFIKNKKNILSLKKIKFSKKVSIKLLKDSWFLILTTLSVVLYMKIDQVMLKAIFGNQEVGEYVAATRLSELWYFIPVIICTSLFPAILNAKNNKKKYLNRIQKLFNLMVFISLTVSLFTTFFADFIIKTIYNEQYFRSVNVLIIHIWGSVFVFLGVASSRWFISENLQKLLLYRSLFGLLINVALNYLLIPIYSIEGAAIATLISQFSSSFLFDIFNKKTNTILRIKIKALFLFWKLHN
jgi:O-antigen/teichoic acid export membrane protein